MTPSSTNPGPSHSARSVSSRTYPVRHTSETFTRSFLTARNVGSAWAVSEPALRLRLFSTPLHTAGARPAVTTESASDHRSGRAPHTGSIRCTGRRRRASAAAPTPTLSVVLRGVRGPATSAQNPPYVDVAGHLRAALRSAQRAGGTGCYSPVKFSALIARCSAQR